MAEKIKNINFLWIEFGEMNYEDALSRKQTIEYMKNKGFRVIEHFSSQGSSGDLLFKRKQ